MTAETTPPPADTTPAATDTPATDSAAPADAAPTPEAKPDAPKSMLEAIDLGLARVGGEPPAPSDDASAVDEDGKPEVPAEKPAPAAAKPAGKANGKEPPALAESPADAKPKPAKEPPAPIDPVNDPIPPEIKGRTRERMTALIGNVKELSAERDRYQGERDEVLGLIQETGASPEQYGQALDFLRAFNSRDPAQLRALVPFLQTQLQTLASMLGEPVPGVDMLRQHQDLRQAVEEGRLTREHAEELAAARALKATRAQEGQQYQQQQQTEQAYAQARSRLTALGRELARTDPLYEQKKDMLVPILQPIYATLPPAQWEPAFRAAYAKLTLPGAALPAPRDPTPRQEPMRSSQQPLRALQHAGTVRREPSSMLDALNEGIEQASRRR